MTDPVDHIEEALHHLREGRVNEADAALERAKAATEAAEPPADPGPPPPWQELLIDALKEVVVHLHSPIRLEALVRDFAEQLKKDLAHG